MASGSSELEMDVDVYTQTMASETLVRLGHPLTVGLIHIHRLHLQLTGLCRRSLQIQDCFFSTQRFALFGELLSAFGPHVRGGVGG